MNNIIVISIAFVSLIAVIIYLNNLLKFNQVKLDSANNWTKLAMQENAALVIENERLKRENAEMQIIVREKQIQDQLLESISEPEESNG